MTINHPPTHSHNNNTRPPSDNNTDIILSTSLTQRLLTIDNLYRYPQTIINYSYVTDHGIHGPYQLEGVALYDLITSNERQATSHIDVISADGYQNQITIDEVTATMDNPIMLCLTTDGQPLSIAHGLIRLVVPSEKSDALRQIKWVRQIQLK